MRPTLHEEHSTLLCSSIGRASISALSVMVRRVAERSENATVPISAQGRQTNAEDIQAFSNDGRGLVLPPGQLRTLVQPPTKAHGFGGHRRPCFGYHSAHGQHLRFAVQTERTARSRRARSTAGTNPAAFETG